MEKGLQTFLLTCGLICGQGFHEIVLCGLYGLGGFSIHIQH